MNESFLSLETIDDHLIYGVLNQVKPSNRLIIFVHGLTGEKENHLYYNGARFFPKNGYHTYRFDLFSNEANGRKLVDCSLTTFSNDLDKVLDYFSNLYQEIHVVGHSIGGCVAMNAKQSLISSFILWDPGLSNDSKDLGPFVFDDLTKLYIANLKIRYFLSPQLIDERAQQGASVVKDLRRPIKLIFAGNTNIKDSWRDNTSLIKTRHEVLTIEGAGHGFNEFGKNDELFNETLNWLQKYRG
jgi:pimeloyl-ACP methyl ester carboxylesterase